MVHRPDRLARELHVQAVALAHAWGSGAHVHEAAEGAEIMRDDQRRFLRQVMGAAAELERGLIKARLQGGRRRNAAAGGYVGGKRLHRRYGYDLVDGEYVPIEREQAAISKIKAYRNTDRGGRPMAWATVAGFMNAQKDEYPTPSGTDWYPMTCRRIAIREGLGPELS